MFKLVLSAGHGKNTAGKRCMKKLDKNETREWVLNDRICDKIETKLKAYDGYELLRVDDTTGKNDIALSKRTKASNNWGANLYLAIHHNAGVKGGTGGGIVAYVYTKPTSKSLEWQKALYNSIIDYTELKGNRATPLAKGNLHECREPKAPAVLIECGFMDSKTDVPIILTDKFADRVATACVEQIVKKGKLTKKKTEDVQSKPNKLKSNEDIAKEVLLGKWGNGLTRKSKLKKAGYDYKAIQKIVNKLLA
jgi:N-acetylmuramoyl-L-alanine amidase